MSAQNAGNKRNQSLLNTSHSTSLTSTPVKNSKKPRPNFSELDNSFIMESTVESDNEVIITDNDRKEVEAMASTSDANAGVVKDTLNLLIPVLNKLIEKAFSKISEKIDEKLDPVLKLRDEMHACIDQHRLETKYELDKLEQYTRRDNIKVAGIQEEDGEDLPKKIIGLAKELNVSLTHSDISTVHRVGKSKQGNPRPVICRFTARHKKDELLKNRKKLKDMPSHKGKTYINEDLTTLRYKLLSYAKSLPVVNRANSHNGKIFCTRSNGALTILDSPDDLFNLGVDELDYDRLGLTRQAYVN